MEAARPVRRCGPGKQTSRKAGTAPWPDPYDEDDPNGIVARLLEALPSGSYLAVSHLASDIQADEMAQLAERFAADEMITETFVMRTRTEVTRFFDGLDLVAPGVVGLDDWRPDDATPHPSAGWVNPFWCGIGHKP